MRVHSTLFTGCTIFESRAPDAWVPAYRWHSADPVLFPTTPKVEIERRGFIMNSAREVVDSFRPRPDYWSPVSYRYQDTMAKPWCKFPAYKDRVNLEVVLHVPGVVDPIRYSAGVELQVLPYNRATWTKPWFRAKNETVGSWIEIPFEIKEKGRYSISLFTFLPEDQGVWKVFIDGQEIYQAVESQIAGGYKVDEVNTLRLEEINKTLGFFKAFRKN